eukprot:4039267-Prymnesium_polylepis.2
MSRFGTPQKASRPPAAGRCHARRSPVRVCWRGGAGDQLEERLQASHPRVSTDLMHRKLSDTWDAAAINEHDLESGLSSVVIHVYKCNAVEHHGAARRLAPFARSSPRFGHEGVFAACFARSTLSSAASLVVHVQELDPSDCVQADG